MPMFGPSVDTGHVTVDGERQVLEERIRALLRREADGAAVGSARHGLGDPATGVADAASPVEERPGDGVVDRDQRERLADGAEGAADAAVGTRARPYLERVLVQ